MEKRKGKSTDPHSRCKTPRESQLLCARIPDPRERRRFLRDGRCVLYCGSRLAGSKQGGAGDISLRAKGYVAGIWERSRVRGYLTELQECMPMGNEGESSQVVDMLIKNIVHGKRCQMRVLKCILYAKFVS